MISIDWVSAISAVGSSALETWCSIEAGIQRRHRSNHVGFRGRHIVSPVLDLDPQLSGAERGMHLAIGALGSRVEDLRAFDALALVLLTDAPLAVGSLSSGPSPLSILEASWEGFGLALSEWLRSRGVKIEMLLQRSSGPASGVDGLGIAREWLDAGRDRRVLWGGVASALEPARLDWLDGESLRLRALRTTPPGESAAFALLGSAIASRPTVRFASTPRSGATAAERLDDLTATLRNVLDSSGPVDLLISDASEDLEDVEAATGLLRALGPRGLSPRVVRPARHLGRLGAATAPLYMALAVEAGGALLALGDDGDATAAVLVDGPAQT